VDFGHGTTIGCRATNRLSGVEVPGNRCGCHAVGWDAGETGQCERHLRCLWDHTKQEEEP